MEQDDLIEEGEQPGVQQWSRGEIFPATIVIRGHDRIYAQLGEKRSKPFYYNPKSFNGFRKAHDKATRAAREMLADAGIKV